MRKLCFIVAFVVVSILGMTSRAAAADFEVTNSGMSAFIINGQSNPALTLTRGHTYTFAVDTADHPFAIQTNPGIGNGIYSTGVTNNGASSGTLTFAVPLSAPSTLYYQCQFHDIMQGPLFIVSATTSTPVPATTNLTRGLLGAALPLLAFTVLGNVRRARQRRRTPAGWAS